MPALVEIDIPNPDSDEPLVATATLNWDRWLSAFPEVEQKLNSLMGAYLTNSPSIPTEHEALRLAVDKLGARVLSKNLPKSEEGVIY